MGTTAHLKAPVRAMASFGSEPWRRPAEPLVPLVAAELAAQPVGDVAERGVHLVVGARRVELARDELRQRGGERRRHRRHVGPQPRGARLEGGEGVGADAPRQLVGEVLEEVARVVKVVRVDVLRDEAHAHERQPARHRVVALEEDGRHREHARRLHEQQRARVGEPLHR